MLALLEPPTPDLFKRAEDAGITSVMCSPWAGIADVATGTVDTLKKDADRYRAAIEWFAENIIEKSR